MTEPAELFPPVPRVIYGSAPLTEVICQLRFPAILRIEETPADFQDRIRDRFPLFERANPVAAQLPPEVAAIVNAQVQMVNYQFRTEDRRTTVSLAPEAIAFSTTAYARWEQFREGLTTCLAAFEAIYRPSSYTRVGLRYRNQINRERLGITARPWSELLSPRILGEFAVPQLEPTIQAASRTVRASVPGRNVSFLFQHGLSRDPRQKNRSYLIDFDFYTERKMEVSDAPSTLDEFNQQARRAFRWSISDALHAALEPRPIDGS